MLTRVPGEIARNEMWNSARNASLTAVTPLATPAGFNVSNPAYKVVDDGAVYSVGKRRKAKSTFNTNSPNFLTATDTNVFFPTDMGQTASICSLHHSNTKTSSGSATETIRDTSMGATSREPPDDDRFDMEAADGESDDFEGYTLVNSSTPTTTSKTGQLGVISVASPPTSLCVGKDTADETHAAAAAASFNVRYVAGFNAGNVYDMTATSSPKDRTSTTCRLLTPNGGVQVETEDYETKLRLDHFNTVYFSRLSRCSAKIVNGRLQAPPVRYGGAGGNKINSREESGSRTSSTSYPSVDREEADEDYDDNTYKPNVRPIITRKQRPVSILAKHHAPSAARKSPSGLQISRSPLRKHAAGRLQKPIQQQKPQPLRISWATTATQTSASASAAGTPRSGSSSRRKSRVPSPIRDIPTVPDAATMSARGVLIAPSQSLSTQGRVSDVLSLDHNTISRPKSPDRRATVKEPRDDDDFAAALFSGSRRMRPSRKAAPKSFAHLAEYFSSKDTDATGNDDDDNTEQRERSADYYVDDKDRAVELTTNMLRDLQADDEEEEYQLPEKDLYNDEEDSADDDDAAVNQIGEADVDDEYYDPGGAVCSRRKLNGVMSNKAGASSSANSNNRRGIKRKRARPFKPPTTRVTNHARPNSANMLAADADGYNEQLLDNGESGTELRDGYKAKLDAYEVDQLLYHQNKDTDLKRNFACPDCGKSYTTPSNLTRHRQVHRNPDDDNSARQCPKCGKKYLSIPAFAMHMLSHKKSYACRMCPKHFSRQWLLHCHERTHTGEKPYVCPVKSCNRSFADHSNYRAHVQTHNESKTFACQVCNKSFNLKSYLTKHQKGSGHRNKRRLVGGSHRRSADADSEMQYENAEDKFAMDEVDCDGGNSNGSVDAAMLNDIDSVKQDRKRTRARKPNRSTPSPSKRGSPSKITKLKSALLFPSHAGNVAESTSETQSADAMLLLAAAFHLERNSSFADVLAEARTPPLSPPKKLAEAGTPPMSPPKRQRVAAEPRTPPMSPPKRMAEVGTPPMSPPKNLAVLRRCDSQRGGVVRVAPSTPPFSPSAAAAAAAELAMRTENQQLFSPKTPTSADVLESIEAHMPRLSIGGL